MNQQVGEGIEQPAALVHLSIYLLLLSLLYLLFMLLLLLLLLHIPLTFLTFSYLSFSSFFAPLTLFPRLFHQPAFLIHSPSTIRMRHQDVLNHHLTMLHATVFLSTILCFVTAGPPNPVHSMAYATVNEKTFYIQGGDPGEGSFTNQFYALDLTQPNWDTSNPPWSILGPGAGLAGGPTSAYHFMAVVDYGQSLMIWSTLDRNNVATNSGRITEYKISNSTWLEQLKSNGYNSAFAPYPGFAKSGATDPGTNLVYVPAISLKDTGLTIYNITEAAVSNIFGGAATTAQMPPPLVEGRVLSGHSTVWIENRGSLLVYGGRFEVPPSGPTVSLQPAVFSDVLVEYKPTQRNWTIVVCIFIAMRLLITKLCYHD